MYQTFNFVTEQTMNKFKHFEKLNSKHKIALDLKPLAQKLAFTTPCKQ